MTEYAEGAVECPDCRQALQPGLPPEHDPHSKRPGAKLVRLRTFNSRTARLDANLARNILETQGIPCVLAGGTMAEMLPGVDPVQLTEFAVIFSAVALPFTYVPILLVANDRSYMREYGNGPVANVLGFVYLFVILFIAVAAVPLMVLTNLGQS